MPKPPETALHIANQTWAKWLKDNPHRQSMRVNATTPNANLPEFHLEVISRHTSKDPPHPKGTRIRLLRTATNTPVFDTCDFRNHDSAFHHAHAAIDEQFEINRQRKEIQNA